jgi:polyisoprenoid-binding protein YceI
MSAKTKWSVNPAHTEISFKVAHLLLSNIKGVFKKFDASIETKENDFTSAKIVFWINLSSLETGDKKRDEHLKSAEFFDVKKHKKMTFVSDGFEKTGKDDCYNLWGYLTMKGITNRIKLDVKSVSPAKDLYGNETAGFTINGKISRKDWGLNWNRASDNGSVMGSDEVLISCKLELLKSNEEELAIESVQSMSNTNNV